MSRPIVLTSPMDGSPQVVRFDATTLWHLDAAEWAPSTASFTSIPSCPRHVRCTLNRCHDVAARRTVSKGAGSRHADEARPPCGSCYSILRPSLLTNARHLPSSRSILAAYSEGVLGTGPPPSEIRRFFTSSELTTWRSSLLSRSMIAGGVPAGASSP